VIRQPNDQPSVLWLDINRDSRLISPIRRVSAALFGAKDARLFSFVALAAKFGTPARPANAAFLLNIDVVDGVAKLFRQREYFLI